MYLLSSLSLLWAVAASASASPAHHDASIGSQLPLNWWPHLPKYFNLPPLREQAEIQDAWTRERLDSIPGLMRKHNVSAWLLSQREYTEEIAFWSLKQATQFSARRRTTDLFLADPKPGVKAHHSWVTMTPERDLWPELRAILDSEKPDSIAINADPDISFASGMHAGELERVRDGLGDKWADKLVSAPPMLSIELIGTQVESKGLWYWKLMSTSWAMISEAFSERVVKPGVTTTIDVEWWLREKLQQMNYTTWFQPSVTIVDGDTRWFAADVDMTAKPRETIKYGDMLHVDFGVTAMGMNTDTQHLAYVLYPGETEDDVPKSLIEGLKKGNRVQDIVRENLKPGLTGNEVLKKSREQMGSEGIEGRIYSHPVGDWGHSAGTPIGKITPCSFVKGRGTNKGAQGFTNLQDGVPVVGDLPVIANTFYSVELGVYHFVPEKNATLFFALEEDVRYDEGQGFNWVYGRQTKFHVIKTPKKGSLQDESDL
ncbi:putative lipo protein [Coniochaeta sp. 2T2.1]|nr:putative lipo protein [Coniochaeta sp. 2T2.1]